MTTERRCLTLLCAVAAASALSLAWSTAEAAGQVPETPICQAESPDPDCGEMAPVKNRNPVAGVDKFTIRPGQTVGGNVLKNDFDYDGDPLSVVPRSQGTFVLKADGTFTFTAHFSPFGADYEFRYGLLDGRGGFVFGTVEINVVNRPPVAVDDFFRIRAGYALSAGVIDNDRDPDGDALSILPGTDDTDKGGEVTFYDYGVFIYRTPIGFVGKDSFDYVLFDSYGAVDDGTVTITVDLGSDAGERLPTPLPGLPQ